MTTQTKTKEPYMAVPFVAFLLAIAAGGMDGYTYFIGKAFSTVQSGNIILLGQSLANKDWQHFTTVAMTLLAFGIGAGMTAIIQRKDNQNWSFKVLIIEILVLFLLTLRVITSGLQPVHICMIISLLAGMQGNAFHKFGQDLVYGNVAVTLVVQNAFSFLVKSFYKEARAFHKSMLYFSILLGFAFGGWMGTLLTQSYDKKALWFPIIILMAIYGTGKYLEKKANHHLQLNPQS